ncbi:MAG: hypothetical protein M1837_000950 [Sclerophora amabilis]|nr:MAG: hypothetical protein M1837_000950 [Sclerophora amabilis]
MPIKLPKGFARRKSSVNALEEVENTPETPSFKVLERPGTGPKSFDGGVKLGKFGGGWPSKSSVNKTRSDSFDDGRANSYRGSGGSNTNSASTGGYYDTASSTRLSSSSTIPSSTDGQNPEDPQSNRQRTSLHNKRLPPAPESQPAFSLRAAGRTFSFGVKQPKSTVHPALPPADVPPPNRAPSEPEEPMFRERAMTDSSYASTATPPKLDTDLGLPDFGEFGDMFDGLGKRRSALMDAQRDQFSTPAAPSHQNSTTSSSPALPPKSYSTSRLDQAMSSPTHPHAREMNSSPYSRGGRTSRDGLMSSPSPIANRSFLDEDGLHGNARAVTPSETTPDLGDNNSFDSRPARPNAAAGTGLRRGSAVLARTSSSAFEDEDAKLVMDSVNAGRFLGQPQSHAPPGGVPVVPNRVKEAENAHQWEHSYASEPSIHKPSKAISPGFPSPTGPMQSHGLTTYNRSSPAGLFDSDDPEISDNHDWRVGSNHTTPKAQKIEPVQQGEAPGLGQQKKVMTPAQFEMYRRQHEQSRNMTDGVQTDDSEEEDTYDDEDDTERHRQLAKQRRKQEAHLAVYRQQMMKVTGEQPADLAAASQPRPGLGQRSSVSAPNLMAGMSSIKLNDERPGETPKSSDDEDDEVPLGILAAHGFPHKNRPPTSFSSPSQVRPASQTGAYPPPAGSVTGENSGGGARSSVLPVFAKHLPQDPYYGAGLVSRSNREGLTYGNSGGSTHGGTSPGYPPGGLVGVIAGEERARAMRRGSPGAQGGYGPGSGYTQGPGSGANPQMPGSVLGGGRTMTMGPGPPANMMMGGMPSFTPGDQAQMQMSQQMTQMMETQMQWMQQMMQMQGMQSGQPSPFAPQSQLPLQQQHQQGPSDFLSPPNPGWRPASMGAQAGPNNLSGGPSPQARTMSMLAPGTSQWNLNNPRGSQYSPSINNHVTNNQGYAPSIAPSERSNIGMPSRYRPVSSATPNGTERASTFTSETLQNWSDKQGRASTINRVGNTTPAQGGHSDDDEEEGWEAMKKTRERKKSMWRHKKEPNSFKDHFFSGH